MMNTKLHGQTQSDYQNLTTATTQIGRSTEEQAAIIIEYLTETPEGRALLQDKRGGSILRECITIIKGTKYENILFAKSEDNYWKKNHPVVWQALVHYESEVNELQKARNSDKQFDLEMKRSEHRYKQIKGAINGTAGEVFRDTK